MPTLALVLATLLASHAAQTQRTQEIARLMATAEAGLKATAGGYSVLDPRDDSATVSAVRKLGAMRAAEAVPLLVEYLDFQPAGPLTVSGFLSLSEALPCVFALGQIASPRS